MSRNFVIVLLALVCTVVASKNSSADEPKSKSKGSREYTIESDEQSEPRKGKGIHFRETEDGIDAEMTVDGKKKVLHFADADDLKKKRSDLYPRYEKLAKMTKASATATATSSGRASVKGNGPGNNIELKFGDDTHLTSDSSSKKDTNENDTTNDKSENAKENDGADALFPEIAKAKAESAKHKAKMEEQMKQFLKKNPDADTYSYEKSSSNHEFHKSSGVSTKSFSESSSGTSRSNSEEK